MDTKDEIRLEILRGSHMEHYKIAKDMSMFLNIDNPRRKKIEEEANKIVNEIHKINKS